jgi:hypothetical protein
MIEIKHKFGHIKEAGIVLRIIMKNIGHHLPLLNARFIDGP